MTKQFGSNFFTINIRNGVGFDLEFTDSRAVWVETSFTEEVIAMLFEGVVLLLPFVVVTFGKIYTGED